MQFKYYNIIATFALSLYSLNATVLDGWDISKLNIGEAMRRAQVLDVGLQDQVYNRLSKLTPRPSIYDPDFIAANQVCFIYIYKCLHAHMHQFIYYYCRR